LSPSGRHRAGRRACSWTTFWWQVSPEVNQGIRDAIARASKGEFVRWDTPIGARRETLASITTW